MTAGSWGDRQAELDRSTIGRARTTQTDWGASNLHSRRLGRLCDLRIEWESLGAGWRSYGHY